MSIFDGVSQEEDPESFKFLKKNNKTSRSFLNKKILFECPIFCLRKDGSIEQFYLKILDHKFVLFQNPIGEIHKFLDFKDMFLLSSFLDDHKKKHLDYTYYITFKKNQRQKTFFVKDGITFAKLLTILKKYCILRNFNENYEILEFLGSGQFAEVYSTRNKNNDQIFAAKIFQKNSSKFSKNKHFIAKEGKILRFLPDCPFVYKLYEIYEDSDEVVLVLELMKGGDLFKVIKGVQKPTEHQIYKIFSDLLKGLLFLHFHGVIHRDIKPENILFLIEGNGSRAKIADLGLAVEFYPEKKIETICGTPGFMAPEILKGGGGYDQKVDVFSLGIVLYMMFIGKPVFRGKDSKEVVLKNKIGKISMRSSEWNNYSKDAKKLVRKMLYLDPAKRIDLQDICNEKWVRKHQSIKSDQTFQVNSKSKMEEPQTDINGTINNTHRLSIQNHQSFKNSFFRRSIYKSKTDIIYSKKISDQITNSNEDAENEIQNEGDINHSKYNLKPKFLQNSKPQNSTQNLALPFCIENYSVNSFLLCSKSDLCSGSSFNNASDDTNMRRKSQQKPSSIDLSENFENNSHNSFEEFLKEKEGSLIFETQREEFDSHKIMSETRGGNAIESRVGSDIDLPFVVPGLVLKAFQNKHF